MDGDDGRGRDALVLRIAQRAGDRAGGDALGPCARHRQGEHTHGDDGESRLRRALHFEGPDRDGQGSLSVHRLCAVWGLENTIRSPRGAHAGNRAPPVVVK